MPHRPNILLIMADNLGAWALGCYGNTEFRTPNLDRLASEGLRCARAYCVNPVCSPNRATLLTGLLPSQHGLHNWLGGEKPGAQTGPDAYNTIGEFPVLSQMLADEGYDCGLFGKWHLGDSLHPQSGFRDWVTLTRGHTADFFDSEVVRDGQTYRETRYYPEVTTGHAIDFLTRPRRQPFFCYVPYTLPYGLNKTLLEGHPGDEAFDEASLTSCPKGEPHPWEYSMSAHFRSDRTRPGYAAEVASLDHEVGRLLDTLDEQGLGDNTLVIFTADHGLLAGQHGLWGMSDHSRPCPLFQENLLIPLLLREPGAIDAGSVLDEKVSHYDTYVTLAEYLQLPVPADHATRLPGHSYAPAFTGQPVQHRRFVLHEYEHVRAIIGDNWKYVHRHPDGPHELYHLADDPGEERNLVDDSAAQAMLVEMRAALHHAFDQYVDPQYDLWNGGRSKAGRLSHPHGIGT